MTRGRSEKACGGIKHGVVIKPITSYNSKCCDY